MPHRDMNIRELSQYAKTSPRLVLKEHSHCECAGWLFSYGFSRNGDADEQPVHPVELSAFWISETPISWAAYRRLMNWLPPPAACPPP